jgi:hypothetical protein
VRQAAFLASPGAATEAFGALTHPSASIPAAAAVQAVVRDYWRFRQAEGGATGTAEASAEAG